VAVAAGTVAAAAATAETDAARLTAAIVGAGGILLLALLLLLGLVQLVAAPAALVGGAYAAALAIDGGGVDLAAPLVAAGLLLTCELAFWAHELRRTSPDEPGGRSGHAAWLSLLTLGALAVGTGLVTLVDVARTDGIAVEVVGAAAALGAAILILAVVRHPRA
jgi:hypothetical protein